RGIENRDLEDHQQEPFLNYDIRIQVNYYLRKAQGGKTIYLKVTSRIFSFLTPILVKKVARSQLKSVLFNLQ
ncbi:MAG: hypothetical protein AABZ55_03410, partial [Bdellovibrionota bacterium]